MKPALNRLVATMVARALRRAFRRVLWVGDRPALPPGRPVVLYANHHHVYDGYLLWLLNAQLLRREGILWMADWDRFPFFAAAGAQPFPPGDPQRRARTIRHTIRRFRQNAAAMLVYFPEGRLHPPDEGVRPFDRAALRRLDGLLSGALWWPVAIHVTWLGEARPTAFLTGGEPHALQDDEQARLEALWDRLRTAPLPTGHLLLAGRRSPPERWTFSFMQKLFDPYG